MHPDLWTILKVDYEENFVIICTVKLQSPMSVAVLFGVKFVYKYKYEGLQSFSASYETETNLLVHICVVRYS